MKDPYNRRSRIYQLPDGQKVRIESREGDRVTVRRVGGPRRQTLAVCRIDQLKPA